MSYPQDRRKLKEQAQERIKSKSTDGSYNQLKATANTRFKTVFVGAVSKIEEHFGVLWGEADDLDEDQMTLEQKKWYYIFLELREKIFDQGNGESKRFSQELSNYTVNKKRSQTIFRKER